MLRKEKEIRLELPAFSGRGTVWSFSTVYDAPEGFEKYVPYTVAVVETTEGPLVEAMLTDGANKDVCIGMEVELVIRRKREMGERGLLVYGYKFRPVLPRVEDKTTQEVIDEILAEKDKVFGLIGE